MKKFVIIVTTLLLLIFTLYNMYYRLGISIYFNPNERVETFTKVEGKDIYVKKNDKYDKFEIKGVNIGGGIPGHFATDYAIDKATYLRWFKQIQDMGANTIRVYTVLQDDFYNAVYEYNINNPNPIYIIHGLWLNDYTQFSSRDAYDADFLDTMIKDARILSDVIHGNRIIGINKKIGNGVYKKDISKWVIGYILGVEWEDVTVAYTDNMKIDLKEYFGKYMYTKENATPFEAMLARLGDSLIQYETARYKDQRLVAFSNWPTTDPIDYLDNVEDYFLKIAKVNVENIGVTDRFKGGYFASYHVYPYYPDYLKMYPNVNDFKDNLGKVNTYYTYLKNLNDFHSMPVVIAEFGMPSSRGMAQRDKYTNRNQGGISEDEQGKGIVDSYREIKQAGCAGSIVFSWQDEWFKRTWNTMQAVDLTKTPYWSDYQTNEQHFGLLSFDPGKEESICYVDGNISDWNNSDIILEENNNTLSFKYDEKFMYFLAKKENMNINSKLFIPINLTDKSGSNYCKNYNLKFNSDVDFIINIDGKDNSRVLVQERYEQERALFNRKIALESPYKNIPDKNTPIFKNIDLLLQNDLYDNRFEDTIMETYETGKLTYGNANPHSDYFNSLADFIINGKYTEIKIPWEMLNFSNPSEMKIHDDYYDNYGVEEIFINSIDIGLITEENINKRANLANVKLKGWGNNISYHERLKKSYYMLQKEWKN